MTHQKLRRDVISVAPGQAEPLTTGGNKVTIKTPLIATRYSLIIRWLSLSVILVALDLRKNFYSSLSPQENKLEIASRGLTNQLFIKSQRLQLA